MKFKEGDRVRLLGDCTIPFNFGEAGQIVTISSSASIDLKPHGPCWRVKYSEGDCAVHCYQREEDLELVESAPEVSVEDIRKARKMRNVGDLHLIETRVLKVLVKKYETIAEQCMGLDELEVMRTHAFHEADRYINVLAGRRKKDC